jgi:MFS family permease
MSATPTSSTGFLGRFLILRGAVRELWVIFGAKFLGIFAYAVMNQIMVLWLSSDLGFSDTQAGKVITLWSTAMTLITVLVGSLVDAIGLRKAFLMGFIVCVTARGLLALTLAKSALLVFGLLALAVGEALLTPVMVAAVRRYATTAQRSIAFSIFYALMNLGFLAAGYLIDFVRDTFGEQGLVHILGLEFSTYRMLFLISFLLTIPNLILVYLLLRPGVEATDEGVKITPEVPKYAGMNLGAALVKMVKETAAETMRIFSGLWLQPAFYKFLTFLTLVVAVRMIFFHMHYTYPKFGIRELGSAAILLAPAEIKKPDALAAKLRQETNAAAGHLYRQFSEAGKSALTRPADTPLQAQALRAELARELNRLITNGVSLYSTQAFAGIKLGKRTTSLLEWQPRGAELARLNRSLLDDCYTRHLAQAPPVFKLWALNPLLIIFLVPIVGALTQKVSAYKMVMVGSFVSATSVFIMAMPTAWFQGMAAGPLGDLVGRRWLGLQGEINPYYVMIFLYTVVLSLGEALWSPRSYEYTASIAPKGQEGSYMALSYLPFFVAKFGAGLLTGYLLDWYCPETGLRIPALLWQMIALMAIVAPLGLIALQRYIRVKEAGRDD